VGGGKPSRRGKGALYSEGTLPKGGGERKKKKKTSKKEAFAPRKSLPRAPPGEKEGKRKRKIPHSVNGGKGDHFNKANSRSKKRIRCRRGAATNRNQREKFTWKAIHQEKRRLSSDRECLLQLKGSFQKKVRNNPGTMTVGGKKKKKNTVHKSSSTTGKEKKTPKEEGSLSFGRKGKKGPLQAPKEERRKKSIRPREKKKQSQKKREGFADSLGKKRNLHPGGGEGGGTSPVIKDLSEGS